jgi:hypothetical protein
MNHPEVYEKFVVPEGEQKCALLTQWLLMLSSKR